MLNGLTRRTVITLGLSTLAVACSGSAKSFRADGYYHEQYPVRIAFPEGSVQPVPFERWQLDNYQRDKKGNLIGRKQGQKYQGQMSFDLNDDGIFETSQEYPIYELLFQHRHSNGELWLSTVPLGRAIAEKDLRVLVDRYVEGVSGTGSAVVLSIAGQPVAVADKHYATRILELRDVEVDGLPGVAATFEVANVDQLQLSPNARWLRAKLVFTRPGFQYTLGRGTGNQANNSWPVLVVVGYSNSTGDFERDLPDFTQFLGEIDFLSDEEAARIYAKPLLDCVGADSFELAVDVNGAGEPLSRTVGVTKGCVLQNIAKMRFAALGVPRKLQVTLTRANSNLGRSKGYVEKPVPTAFPEAETPVAPSNGSGSAPVTQ